MCEASGQPWSPTKNRCCRPLPHLRLGLSASNPLNRWIVAPGLYFRHSAPQTSIERAMASSPITLRDVREAFEIIGECCELWADPRHGDAIC